MDFKKTKKRFFEYGVKVGFLKSGFLHSIADVDGVTVGHATKIVGKDIRTGVTIIDSGLGAYACGTSVFASSGSSQDVLDMALCINKRGLMMFNGSFQDNVRRALRSTEEHT